ncbi:hypothetical protein F2Q68_00000672 [Brassica cretica]|uniref:Uncharacterized protein n=1 Tax=Brassica cretica TaxID=69181 RepID=A0A8S9JEV9_BRACR|nr:hypothetical protein F2Q68_00000672 [Brassica cretica]
MSGFSDSSPDFGAASTLGALVLHFHWTHRSRRCWQGDLLLLEGPAADDSAGHPCRGHQDGCCRSVV